MLPASVLLAQYYMHFEYGGLAMTPKLCHDGGGGAFMHTPFVQVGPLSPKEGNALLEAGVRRVAAAVLGVISSHDTGDEARAASIAPRLAS